MIGWLRPAARFRVNLRAAFLRALEFFENQDGRAAAYGRPVDIVLRHYPAEHLHELPAAGALLDARVLWLNDPRAVVAQRGSACSGD